MKLSRIAWITSTLIFLPMTSVRADTVNYSDTTKPIIESITLNPTIVNVTSKGATLIATIVASDDLNTMNSFNGYLMPLYGANPQASSNDALSTKVVNGRVQVTFQLKYVFEKGTPTGDYQIRATVYDAADNRLIAAGANMPGNAFKVINDASSSAIDVTQFDYAVKMQNYLAQIQSLTSELATNKMKTAQLEKQIEDLNSKIAATKTENEAAVSKGNPQIQALQTKFNSLEKKLKAICSKKPKPKGC
jgi:hypothetical protein